MPNVSVHDLDGMTPLNCLVVAKGINHTTPIKYCSQKLKNAQYDSIDDSFIFKLNNRYLQWVFNQIEDYGGRIYFRVLFRKNKIAITTITDSITPIITTNIHADISVPGQTATFNQNDSILNATTITTYDRPTHTVNYGMIICNCVLCILVLLVWVVLYLKHHRSRKQVSMQTTEETSSNREASMVSNYDTISLNTIQHPIHITNETSGAAWV
ncbi:uncharacterized protein LOC143046953 [Mytilus galloprovincialis]|uniref:uncharacterized protein LOC143046953 n=1 Tax=Mytilus galloprovincialis TaxID=29158 RepID=UPI003F7C32B5